MIEALIPFLGVAAALYSIVGTFRVEETSTTMSVHHAPTMEEQQRKAA